MSGIPDHKRASLRPFLVAQDEAGAFSLTVRETRYNSQDYPIVTARLVAENFATATAARAHAKAHFGAATGEFELPPRRVAAGRP